MFVLENFTVVEKKVSITLSKNMLTGSVSEYKEPSEIVEFNIEVKQSDDYHNSFNFYIDKTKPTSYLRLLELLNIKTIDDVRDFTLSSQDFETAVLTTVAATTFAENNTVVGNEMYQGIFELSHFKLLFAQVRLAS